jgi:hypothetical protein
VRDPERIHRDESGGRTKKPKRLVGLGGLLSGEKTEALLEGQALLGVLVIGGEASGVSRGRGLLAVGALILDGVCGAAGAAAEKHPILMKGRSKQK